MRAFVVGLAALLLAACRDPGYMVVGTVRGPADVEQVGIHVVCEDGLKSNPLHVAADGTVKDANMGVMPMSCVIAISAPGMHTQRIPVAEACVALARRDHCEVAYINVTLE